MRFQRGFLIASRTCQACHGTGKRITNPCATCHGAAVTSRTDEMTIKVPPGVADGSVRSVRGGGQMGPGGPGDLHVVVRVLPHPLFVREGADIVCQVPISFPQAALGAQIDVPTLEGKVKMKIPAGTQTGKVFRLRGKGIQHVHGNGRGDQHVRVVVETPSELNKQQKELFEKLAEISGEETHPQSRSFFEKVRELFG